jgi:histidinol-phosphate aminotransferase
VEKEYESVVPLLGQHPNLVVARTFSKIYGMAGLRCGYALANREVIEKLRAHAAWDTVNVMALAAARASIADPSQVEDGRRRNLLVRGTTVTELSGLGYKAIPSSANFFMVDLGRDVTPVIAAFKEQRVEVGRRFPAMPTHLRVTVGTPEQMRSFLAAFKRVMA